MRESHQVWYKDINSSDLWSTCSKLILHCLSTRYASIFSSKSAAFERRWIWICKAAGWQFWSVSIIIWIHVSHRSWTREVSSYNSRKCPICQSWNSKWNDSYYEQCGYWRNRERGRRKLVYDQSRCADGTRDPKGLENIWIFISRATKSRQSQNFSAVLKVHETPTNQISRLYHERIRSY